MHSFVSLGVVVVVAVFLGSALAANTIDITAREGESIVYGVRWFLGEKFRFQKPVVLGQNTGKQHQYHLVLFFNSEKSWKNHTFAVKIRQKNYYCSTTEVMVNISSDHHNKFNQFASNTGDEFINFIYKCPVYFEDSLFLQKTSKFCYEIAVQGPVLSSTLVRAELRSPAYNLSRFSMTAFGDWGMMTPFSPQYNISTPIDDCLVERVKADENIRIMLLLGDLAYDIEGKNYIQFMKYLQKYSRQIAILFSPGNHETIKHKDIFLLAKESFYTPSWQYFYGYFDLVQLGDYVFLGVNTEAYFWDGLAVQSNSSLFTLELEEDYQSFENLFKMQLPEQTITKLKNDFKVIGYSHYPIYCSEEDNHQKCSQYLDRHEEVLRIYRELGMQLYLSGHLHVYERSKQICKNGLIFKEGTMNADTFMFKEDEDCCVFIIEGAAGNNYYVETERHFPLKNHSGAFVNNTGFGVLELRQDQIIFEHIASSESCCLVADRIIIVSQNKGIRLFHILQGILILICLIIPIFVFWRRRVVQKREEQKLDSRSMASVSQLQLSDA